MSASPPHNLLRSQAKPTKKKRRHLIESIYGSENSNVRLEVSKLENSHPRFLTGIPSDPTHTVEYSDHPYHPNRNLQVDGNDDILFRPLRIHVVTSALELQRNALNTDQIDFIKNVILPKTVAFWSNALSVVPVNSNLKIDRSELSNSQFCGDSEFTQVPLEHIADGVPDTDLIWYVSGQPSSRFCGPSTLAVAVGCNFDQFDRPTAGAINFCLEQVELADDGTASAAITQDNVDVAVHEAAHILGMSSNSYKLFYDSQSGRPRTSRPFTMTTQTCVDGVQRSSIFPGEDTLKFFMGENGQRYASIVTPKVKTVVRNQFACQSLEGAALENQPTGSQSCTGDHWEEKLYYPEMLTGVISPTTNILSPLTLALMEDSGWYMANYSLANVSPWGHGVGCDFINGKCVDSTTNDNDESESIVPDYGRGFFCDKSYYRGCSPAATHKMACTMIDYSLYFPPQLPPEQFQYFSKPSLGGPRQADYCPVFGSTYSGLSAEELECGNGDNMDTFNLFGEFYGQNSMCFESNTGAGRCYKSQCILSERVLKVSLRNQWETCTYDFEEIPLLTSNTGLFEGILVCPRLSAACPEIFCPANCAGRGTCDYDNEINGTIVPLCRCFNTSDTSSGCSDSLVLDGKYLEDSGLLDLDFNGQEETRSGVTHRDDFKWYNPELGFGELSKYMSVVSDV